MGAAPSSTSPAPSSAAFAGGVAESRGSFASALLPTASRYSGLSSASAERRSLLRPAAARDGSRGEAGSLLLQARRSSAAAVWAASASGKWRPRGRIMRRMMRLPHAWTATMCSVPPPALSRCAAAKTQPVAVKVMSISKTLIACWKYCATESSSRTTAAAPSASSTEAKAISRMRITSL